MRATKFFFDDAPLFALGLAAGLARSDLRLPSAIDEFLTVPLPPAMRPEIERLRATRSSAFALRFYTEEQAGKVGKNVAQSRIAADEHTLPVRRLCLGV